MNVTIVDYGMGNINSVKKRLKQLGANTIVTSNEKDILSASKIILPGIGHFAMAMENLQKHHLIDALHEAVLIKKTPILGICLGMQLMASHSEEGDTAGLGWFEGNVVRFTVKDPYVHKIPHTGWNTVDIKQINNPLVKDIPQQSEFYFVHAYHFNLKNIDEELTATTYDYTFTSAIARENIYGVQYHPEKSHQVGETIFKNFIQL